MRSTDFTRDDVRALRDGFQGTVVLPDDPRYHVSRQLSNRVFQQFPQLLAYCEVPGDVRRALRFARENGLAVTTRSGGHCTAGFSVNDGMVIDTGRLSYVVVDPRARRAVVGAGTSFGRLNAALDEWGLHVPGGGCDAVSVAGHMQGGGYGFTSRSYGLNCDNVVEAVVMLGDGRIVVADEARHPDLFWALRGGTGNNFGVLLQVTYTLHNLGEVWGFALRWPLRHAAEVLARLQSDFARGGPRELGYLAVLVFHHGEACLVLRGLYAGPREEGMRATAALFDGAAVTEIDRTGSYYALNAYLVASPTPVPEVPDLARQEKQSAIFDQELDAGEWEGVVAAFRHSPRPWSALFLEPYGGRLAEIPREATAFIHRGASANVFCDVFWLEDEERGPAIQFLDDMMRVVAPYGSGHQYQNYPRRGFADYARAFWGDAYPRLRRVKSRYDPDGVFRFAQGVEPLRGAEHDAARAEPVNAEPTVHP